MKIVLCNSLESREWDLFCGSLDQSFSGDEAGINRAGSLLMAIGNDASPGLTPEAWPCCMTTGVY